MKKTYALSMAVLSLLALALPSQAQIITWGLAQNMVGTADISTTGTFVDAIDFNSTQTIGDTTFNNISAANNATDTSGDIMVTGSLSPYGGTSFSPSPASPAYLAVMSSIAFTVGNPGSVVLTNLMSGDTYQIELWGSYNGSVGANNTTFSGPAGSNSVTLDPNNNVFALGTFTATSSSVTIPFTPGTTYAVFNAVSLRDTTVAAPEPSTYVLMGLGFLGLVVLRKRLASL
jgi:hypothetical protein